MERRSLFGIALAVFIAGGVLLGLELAASRVLAPFFGSSLFVWGSLIGVVLTGLSAGYWFGGALADRWPNPRLLFWTIAVSAGLVLAIPLVDEWAMEQVLSLDPGPRASPLLATIVLFGIPSVVIGGVSPIAVKLAATELARVGRTAGRLYAISTAGSITGTFVTSFWLIPELGTDQMIAVGATALLVASALVAVSTRLLPELALAVVLTAVSLVPVSQLAPEEGGVLEGAAAKNWSPVYRTNERDRAEGDPARDIASAGFDIVFAKDTRYHRMIVADDEDTRYLRFDNSFQSAMYKKDPFATRFEYADYLHLSLAYNADAKRILFIGLGGGSAPKRFWRDYPDLELQAVELDPDVVDAAYKYFELPRSTRLEVASEDGRRWLQRHEERWDAIVIDAFYADSIPFHLATAEFMQLVRERLNSGGVVVTNMIGAISGESSRLTRSLVRTYRSAFPTVVIHPVNFPGDRRADVIRNLVIIGTESAAPSEEFLAERWAEIRREHPQAPELTRQIRDRWDRDIRTADVPLLTDDYAPTDALLLLYG